VGTALCNSLVREGHEVTVLTRSDQPLPWHHRVWDGRTLGDWAACLDDADVLLNLAGATVNCRYNRKNRERILNSRVESTRTLAQAVAGSAEPPKVWLQASTATIYAHTYDEANGESGVIGGDEPDAPDSWRFSTDVAKAWEQSFDEVDLPSTRKVKLRSAMTMNPDPEGIFDVLLGLVRRGLGGTSGNGRQFVSWIHQQDFNRALHFLIGREDLSGAFNLAAPNPLPNADFMRALRAAWGTRIGLPSAAWMLEIGAIFLRTETELVLKSRKVVPDRLLESGFEFLFPKWSGAAEQLCRDWRTQRGR